jgi:hypothetical protein
MEMENRACAFTRDKGPGPGGRAQPQPTTDKSEHKEQLY